MNGLKLFKPHFHAVPLALLLSMIFHGVGAVLILKSRGLIAPTSLSKLNVTKLNLKMMPRIQTQPFQSVRHSNQTRFLPLRHRAHTPIPNKPDISLPIQSQPSTSPPLTQQHTQTLTVATSAVKIATSPTQGIQLPAYISPPLVLGYRAPRIWRSSMIQEASSPPPAIAIMIPNGPSMPNPVISADRIENEARQAQVIGAWMQWSDTPSAIAKSGKQPLNRAVCAVHERIWRCTFDDIPSRAVTLDSETLSTAFTDFQHSQGGNAIRLERQSTGEWRVSAWTLSLPPLPSSPQSDLSHNTLSTSTSTSEPVPSTPATIQSSLN